MMRTTWVLGFVGWMVGCVAEVVPSPAAPQVVPVADVDGDGVLDVSDGCPAEPEDVDTYQDTDGCPDLDNDQDRVPDTADACPCVPEVYNGTDDEDGCPDRGNVVLVYERIDIIDKVYFARGSARIEPSSVPAVDAVATALLHYPLLTRIEVAGHAARDEPDALALSEARATAVRDALIAAGVDGARLVVRGHGRDGAVAAGGSRDARNHSRRVDFVILEPAQGPGASPPEAPLPSPVPGCASASGG